MTKAIHYPYLLIDKDGRIIDTFEITPMECQLLRTQGFFKREEQKAFGSMSFAKEFKGTPIKPSKIDTYKAVYGKNGEISGVQKHD